jgi:hypothetical protein
MECMLLFTNISVLHKCMCQHRCWSAWLLPLYTHIHLFHKNTLSSDPTYKQPFVPAITLVRELMKKWDTSLFVLDY